MNEIQRYDNGVWKLSPQGMKSLGHFHKQHQSKHGLYSAVPMICHGAQCPYSHACAAQEYGEAPVGERCTREIVMILQRLEVYCDALKIDETSIIELSLLKDLIDAEIMILRADSLISREGAIVEDITVGITPKGMEITQPAITKAVDLKERWMGIRHKVLNQLNSTPKDKAKEGVSSGLEDRSKYAARLIRLAQEMDVDV